MNGIPIAKGPAHLDRRTKIVATVGPASWDRRLLEQMIAAGPTSSGSTSPTREQTNRRRRSRRSAPLRETVGREVAVLGDLPGPKLRIGELRDDFAELETGMHVTLTPSESRATASGSRSPGRGSPRCARTSSSTSPTARSGCAFATPSPSGVGCEVEVGGTLSSHKGMNIPDGAALPAATDGDLGWVEFAAKHGVDLLAVSFVSTADDLVPVRERLDALGSDIPLIAKIERQQAAENVEEIVEAATAGIMVARGDLGIEVPLAEVPVAAEAPDPHRRQALQAGRSRRPRCWPRWSPPGARPGPR